MSPRRSYFQLPGGKRRRQGILTLCARLLPSALGDAAKRQAVTNSGQTIYSIKRFMGRKYDEVQEEIRRVPYKVVRASNGDAAIEVQVDGKPKQFSPPEISAMILGKLKADAEMRLGEKITQAVITTPAYFNDSQRQATKDAGRIAGLEVLRIINEPTAASLAYGLDRETDEKIAVYDLGGGTFDISVLELGDGVFQVKATNGDTHLGGDDWDNRLMDWMLGEFKQAQGMDLRKQPDAMQRIKEEAEKAKIALSSELQYEISLPFITADASGPKHLGLKLTRAKMIQLCDDLFERTVGPVKACLQDAGVTASKIDQLVLVGGMTRMPHVVDTAKTLVNKPPHQGVNPDEVVAMGAAIQAGVLKGEVKDVVLLDVTPLSLGIETLGGVFTKLIERNATIPVRKSQTFSTAADNQPGVEIHVLQGERQFSRDSKSIGRFKLEDIPPAPRGVPQIEVGFDIDANGILHVSAKDLGTGKEQKIAITASSGLSKEEIERMRKDGELHAEEDRKSKEALEARNEAENLVYRTEKMLKDNGANLSEANRGKIQAALRKVKDVLSGNDVTAITSEVEQLNKVWQAASTELYQKSSEKAPRPESSAGRQPETGARPESSPNGEAPIIDAEVVEETKAA